MWEHIGCSEASNESFPLLSFSLLFHFLDAPMDGWMDGWAVESNQSCLLT